MLGALFFNVNTIAALLGLEIAWEKELYVWAPAIVGSCCFLAGDNHAPVAMRLVRRSHPLSPSFTFEGGIIECDENSVLKPENFGTTSWYLFNLSAVN